MLGDGVAGEGLGGGGLVVVIVGLLLVLVVIAVLASTTLPMWLQIRPPRVQLRLQLLLLPLLLYINRFGSPLHTRPCLRRHNLCLDKLFLGL